MKPSFLPFWFSPEYWMRAPFAYYTWGGLGGAALGIVGNAVLANNTKKPQVAMPTPVDLQVEQDKALKGNIANQQKIEDLVSSSNKFAQQQANSLMEKAVPGYSQFAQSLLKSGREALTNPYDLPQDVQDNLTRIAAERGISRGTRGQFNDYSALRDLGVNMLDYGNNNFNRAMSALTTVAGTAPRISPMSPMSFYVTPGMSAENQAQTNQAQQAIQQGSYNADAALSNFKTQSLWDSITKAVGTIDWKKISAGNPGGGTAVNVPGTDVGALIPSG